MMKRTVLSFILVVVFISCMIPSGSAMERVVWFPGTQEMVPYPPQKPETPSSEEDKEKQEDSEPENELAEQESKTDQTAEVTVIDEDEKDISEKTDGDVKDSADSKADQEEESSADKENDEEQTEEDEKESADSDNSEADRDKEASPEEEKDEEQTKEDEEEPTDSDNSEADEDKEASSEEEKEEEQSEKDEKESADSDNSEADEDKETSSEEESDEEDSEKTDESKKLFGIETRYLVPAVAAVCVLIILAIVGLSRKKKNRQDEILKTFQPDIPLGTDVIELDFLSGKKKGTVEVLPIKTGLIIGSGPECDLTVEGFHVADKHARVFINNGMLYLEDLDTDDGTYIDGARLFSANRIKKDSVVTVGSVSFRIRY